MSEEDLFCTYCSKKLHYDGESNNDYIDLDEIAKLGWIIEDFGLFCSKECRDDYLTSRENNDVLEFPFNGVRSIGKESIIFGNTMIGFPTRTNILKRMIGKEVAHEPISIGNSAIIRPGTIIYEDVVIGDNFETGHYVLIREKTNIGNNVRVGSYSVIEGDVEIGNSVNIQSFVFIPKFTYIGDNVFIAPRVTFTNDKYPPTTGGLFGATVENDVVICANATILPGITISEKSVVAAGAVVTKNIPSFSMAIGSPAKTVNLPEEYIEKFGG